VPMTTLLVVLTFLVVYAGTAALANRVSVYWLDFWDPKFRDQVGNVAVADEVLPVFAAIATLVFLAGLAVQRAALARKAPTVAEAALCAGIAGGLLLAEPGLRYLGAPRSIAGVAGMAAFWAGPAVVATVVPWVFSRWGQARAV